MRSRGIRPRLALALSAAALMLAGCVYAPPAGPGYAYGYGPYDGYYAPGYYYPAPVYPAPAVGSVFLGFGFGGGHRHWR